MDGTVRPFVLAEPAASTGEPSFHHTLAGPSYKDPVTPGAVRVARLGR